MWLFPGRRHNCWWSTFEWRILVSNDLFSLILACVIRMCTTLNFNSFAMQASFWLSRGKDEDWSTLDTSSERRSQTYPVLRWGAAGWRHWFVFLHYESTRNAGLLFVERCWYKDGWHTRPWWAFSARIILLPAILPTWESVGSSPFTLLTSTVWWVLMVTQSKGGRTDLLPTCLHLHTWLNLCLSHFVGVHMFI